MLLKDAVGEARERIAAEAGGAIDRLAGIASELEMRETAARLEQAAARLRSDSFSVVVVGRFKTGKSTLMNALLGRVTHPVPELPAGQGPLPSDDLPCTATLTRIRYSEKAYVRAWRFDEKWEGWSLERYLRESTVRGDEAETQKFFREIREFELGFPAELCRSGVTLLDSPGTADIPQRTEVTRQAVRQCDAAMVVYRSDVFAGQDERAFAIQEVEGSGTRVFTVVNLMDGRALDDRFRGFVWDRLVRERADGAPYSGQEFEEWDVYFVDARRAREGKFRLDSALVHDSGLEHFEERLGKFLIEERQAVHLARFLRAAELLAGSLEQQIAQRRAALERDTQELERAYQAVQPQLQAIRGRRERLPALFAHHAATARTALRASFEGMMARTREELPEALRQRPLPSTRNLFGEIVGQFMQKKICREALEACSAIVTERVQNWGAAGGEGEGAEEALAPILEILLNEVREEVAGIEREYGAVHLQLTGWTPPENVPSSVVGLQERIVAGVAGLFVGDWSSLLGIAGSGWRGVAGNLAGQLAAFAVLSVLHVTGMFLGGGILLAGLVGNIVWGGHGLEQRVKETVLKQVEPELARTPDEALAQIDRETEALFSRLEAAVMQEVNAAIQEEEGNIRKMVDLNRRSQGEKTVARSSLDEMTRRVVSERGALEALAGSDG